MWETLKDLLEHVYVKKKEEQFSNNTIHRVAEAIHFKDDCAISEVNGDDVFIFTSNTHQTSGKDSLHAVTSWGH